VPAGQQPARRRGYAAMGALCLGRGLRSQTPLANRGGEPISNVAGRKPEKAAKTEHHANTEPPQRRPFGTGKTKRSAGGRPSEQKSERKERGNAVPVPINRPAAADTGSSGCRPDLAATKTGD